MLALTTFVVKAFSKRFLTNSRSRCRAGWWSGESRRGAVPSGFLRVRVLLLFSSSRSKETDGMLIVFSDSPAKKFSEKPVVPSLFAFTDFRSSTRRRFPLQFDLIVLDGGTDEIF
jgi:hypothetical protein